MLKLIYAELNYNKRTIIAALVFSFIVILLHSVEDAAMDLNEGYYLLGYLVFMYMLGRWGHYIFFKDEIDVIHAKLPLSIQVVGAARILTGLIIWASLLSLFLIWLLFSYSKLNGFNLWSVLAVNGIVLFLNSVPYIWNDYLFYSRAKRRKIFSYFFYFPVTFGILGLVYLSTFVVLPSVADLQNELQQMFFDEFSSILLNLLGAVSSYFSYKLFIARSSYLGSEFGLKSNAVEQN